jgi:histidyl-tRNA synthetase
MSKPLFQSPKGTRDVLPSEQVWWQRVEETARRIVRLYGYERLDLPVFEDTALFQRGVGAGTDIVDKEMYTFLDKGGSSITLRPEFTAGVMRAYLEHSLGQTKPVKVWSMGPVFRYERPQAGRFRQHTQFNVEALGETDPALDFEIMSIAFHLYRDLNFKNLSFEINSIGCPVCRPSYLERLKTYYAQHETSVCEDCRKRLAKNPLRVLDCKQAVCQPVIAAAPPIHQSLCAECDEHFRDLRGYLDDHHRAYRINHRLVRGLDYYTKTVFEVWAQGIGAQNAVCGGGRYDGLAEALGGDSTPGVGFASGMERIVLNLQQNESESVPSFAPTTLIAPMGGEAKRRTMGLLTALREAGIPSVIGFGSRSLKSQMREANRLGVRYVLIVGDEELGKSQVVIKRMDREGQETADWDAIVPIIRNETEHA